MGDAEGRDWKGVESNGDIVMATSRPPPPNGRLRMVLFLNEDGGGNINFCGSVDDEVSRGTDSFIMVEVTVVLCVLVTVELLMMDGWYMDSFLCKENEPIKGPLRDENPSGIISLITSSNGLNFINRFVSINSVFSSNKTDKFDLMSSNFSSVDSTEGGVGYICDRSAGGWSISGAYYKMI
jgi:hypothetical protein